MFEKIQVDFTSQALPAPYAQQCSIVIELKEAHLQVKASLVYIDRENLTLEEIWEEGFSGEDDFHWEGNFTTPWVTYLLGAIQEGEEGAAAQPGETIVVNIQSDLGSTTIKNKKRWIYIMQEMLQSIYEADGLEAPLQLRYKRNDEEIETFEVSLMYFFKDLKVAITSTQGKKQKNISGDWMLCSQLLREIYIPDYLTEKAEELAEAPGTYIDPGGGLWYNAKQAIKLGKKSYGLDKIKTLLDEITR